MVSIETLHTPLSGTVELLDYARQQLPEWLDKSEMDNQIRVTSEQGLTIVSANMGEIFDNPKLVDKIIDRSTVVGTNIDTNRIWETVNNAGITTRHASPARYEGRETSEKIIHDTAHIAGTLLQVAMNESGRVPTHVIDATLSLSTELNPAIRAAAGLDDATGESVRAACAGGLIGVMMALANPDLKGQTIAIVCAEPIGALQDERMFYELDHIATPAIFGDGYSVLIFNTDDFELIDGAIEVVPGGGISIHTEFGDSIDGQFTIPDYLLPYITVQPEDEQLVRINEHGFFVKQESPEDDMNADMKGNVTLKHFLKYTPDFMKRFLERPRVQQIKNAIQFMFNHQPSGAVTGLMQAKMEKLGITPNISFHLEEMGSGNNSSATTIRHLQHMMEKKIDNQTLDLRQPFVGLSMGIGSVLAALVMKRRQYA